MHSDIDDQDDARRAILTEYHALTRRRTIIVLGLAAAALGAFLLDVVTGPSSLSAGQVLMGIVSPESLTAPEATIVWQIRLPYAVMAVLVGVALALAGAEMQTILDNPLASPFTLGVSAAAAFGASVAIVLGFGAGLIGADWLVSVNAFVFAFGAMLLLLLLSRLRGGGSQSMVLFGIALVFAFNALTSLVQFVSSQEALQQLVFWTMGSLSRATWSNVAVLAIVVGVIVPFALTASRHLTALRLGEDRARSFGVDVGRLRLISLLRISLLAAAAVSVVGAIGFIGLIGPHMARMMVGEDHRVFLPASMLCGAFIMSLASAASKALVPGTLMPLGIVTAIVGVPLFLLLVARNGARG